jgi:hypothetical protein
MKKIIEFGAKRCRRQQTISHFRPELTTTPVGVDRSRVAASNQINIASSWKIIVWKCIAAKKKVAIPFFKSFFLFVRRFASRRSEIVRRFASRRSVQI